MRSVFFFLTFLFTCNIGRAQEPAANNPLVLSNISEQNGLSDDHVQCVLKDKQGFVWIGTSDGLNLMDGSDIKIFRHIDKDTNSVASNNILCLTEDSVGNIWIGTAGGISCYQRSKRIFSSVIPDQSPYGAAIFINAIAIDKQSKIWCSTDGGLMQYEPARRKFIPYYNLSTEQESNITYSNKLHYLIADSKNNLWLCTTDGVWSFNLQTLTFKKEIHKNNDAAYHGLFLYAFEDHAGTIWAGNWQNGLKRIDRYTGKVTNYVSLPGHPGTINCINEIKQPGGNYILWLNGSLLAFDPASNKFFQFPKPLQSPEYPVVSPCFRSPDGWVWLASDKGLYIYSPQRQTFSHYFFNSPVTSQGIVFTEWNNLLLTGAQSASLLKAYDKTWNLKKDFSPALLASCPSGKFGSALSFAKENENDLWMGNSEGIVNINLLTGRQRWFTHKEGDSTTLPRNFIACLFLDSKKQLWVFPWREGIWQMNKESGECKRLCEGFIQEREHIKRLLIADAVEDKEGNIWMADLDEGIILFDHTTQKFSKPFLKELGETYHTSRIFFQNGFCYTNTSSSILKWDPRDRKLHIFGLPPAMNKIVYEMAPDKKGDWWLASQNGLIVFNETENSFRRYTTTNGLVSNDMSGTLYCKQDGTMLFGMPGYITAFNPDDLLATSRSPGNVVLTSVQVNYNPMTLNNASVLELDHRSTNIVFRWALPDYSNPLRNQYYCQLQGIDAGWNYAGNKGEIQYANLSAGKYRILLKAASSNGTESANTITIDFVIHPPFWKTWWFLSLIYILLLIILLFVVRYISQRNLKEKLLRLEKEQAVEKERNRISRDMHDDLGSGLTKIAIMSEVVKKQIHEPEKAKQQLERISDSSRELVDNLQDIIWVLNPKNDTLDSLAAYIREYALKYFEPFETAVHFNYPSKFADIKLSEETRRNIFLVIKESFNNIAKHAWCNHVTITIIQTHSLLRLEIEDDGKGFDVKNVRLFGNGLLNMKNRIEQVGGEYTIESQAGKGTKMTIEIPI
jgi:signal transduction histidine kinase/ligand-binding sensor domain-containing protein